MLKYRLVIEGTAEELRLCRELFKVFGIAVNIE